MTCLQTFLLIFDEVLQACGFFLLDGDVHIRKKYFSFFVDVLCYCLSLLLEDVAYPVIFLLSLRLLLLTRLHDSGTASCAR